MANVIVLRTCRWCNAAFQPKRAAGRNYYCPTCRPAVRKDQARKVKAAGFCPGHPDRPLAPGRKSGCVECMARISARNKRVRKAARERGECAYHPGRPVAPGRTRCAECLAKMTDGAKRYKYGLAKGEWDAIFASQGRRCAICGSDTTERHWHTDHDHDTGRVRGILCLPCNLMLGYAKDDPMVLAEAIRYLAVGDAKEVG